MYVSAWLKCHHPAAFTAALINSQPMGFYAPAQIIHDARKHGVEIRTIDVHHSRWDCVLDTENGQEKSGSNQEVASPALRLGMRLIKGMRRDEVDAIVRAVAQHPDPSGFDSVQVLWRASGVRTSAIKQLASADAFRSMGLDRQAALWQVRALHNEVLPLFDGNRDEEDRIFRALPFPPRSSPSPYPAFPFLPAISEPHNAIQDYLTTGLSLRGHPVYFIRNHLVTVGVAPAIELKDEDRWPHGSSIAVAGIVLVRQQPATDSKIIFMTLEDETSVSNLVVRPKIFEWHHQAARHGVAIIARGRIERQGQVAHILVRHLEDISDQIRDLAAVLRYFY